MDYVHINYINKIKIMEQSILILVMIAGLLAFNEISILKKCLQSQEEQINQLAKLTGHEYLSSYWISDEIKELVIHLKRTGKEAKAVKKIREHTNMTINSSKKVSWPTKLIILSTSHNNFINWVIWHYKYLGG